MKSDCGCMGHKGMRHFREILVRILDTKASVEFKKFKHGLEEQI